MESVIPSSSFSKVSREVEKHFGCLRKIEISLENGLLSQQEAERLFTNEILAFNEHRTNFLNECSITNPSFLKQSK